MRAMTVKGPRFAGYVIGAIGLIWLAFMAARAASVAPGFNPVQVTADLVVGLAFILAGVMAPGSRPMRLLIAAVGSLWLVGSWLSGTGLWHQALLAVALTVFPRGKPSGKVRWLLVGLAVPAGLGLIPQVGVAVLFATVAITTIVMPHAQRGRPRYAVVSAAALAAVLAGSWAYSRIDPAGFDPLVALLLYEFVLVAIAIGFPLAIQSLIASRAKLTDLVLSDDGLAGLGGLASVLGEALQDPALRVHRWHGAEIRYRPASGTEPGDPDTRGWLEVMHDNEPIAALSYSSPALEDPSTMDAVSTAVRLAVRHQQLQERLQVQLVNLEAARARLMAAVDRQRQITATRLRKDVIPILRRARTELATMGKDVDESAALILAFQELARAEEEVAGLVAGVPPALLGNGRLESVLSELADRSPIPVTLTASPGAATDAETEAALFYVCSEALTNAVKHAGAARIEIALKGDRDTVALRISDNGRGGADPSGSGLQGLSDRVAARGGRLQVESPPGTGTTVTATLPR